MIIKNTNEKISDFIHKYFSKMKDYEYLSFIYHNMSSSYLGEVTILINKPKYFFGIRFDKKSTFCKFYINGTLDKFYEKEIQFFNKEAMYEFDKLNPELKVILSNGVK